MVIDLVETGVGYGQGLWCDLTIAAAQIGTARQVIVAGTSAAQGQTGDGVALVGGCTRIFSVKRTHTVQCHRIATQHAYRVHNQVGHRGGAVVYLLGTARAQRNRQTQRHDGGGSGGLARNGVVATVGTAIGAHKRDRLVGAHIPVSKGTGDASQGDNIIGDQSGLCEPGSDQGRRGVTVIDLVRSRNAGNGQGLGRDIRRACSGGGDEVIVAVIQHARVQTDARDVDRLADGNVLVGNGKGHKIRCFSDHHTVTCHQTGGSGDDRCRGQTVIHLVDTGIGRGQCQRVDLTIAAGGGRSRNIAAVGQVVVAGISPRQGHAGDGVGLSRTDVLVGICTAAGDIHYVACLNAGCPQNQPSHCDRAVIRFSRAGDDCGGQRFGADLLGTYYNQCPAKVHAATADYSAAHLVTANLQPACCAVCGAYGRQVDGDTV